MAILDRFTMWLNAFTIGFCIPGILFFSWPEKLFLIFAVSISAMVLIVKIEKINGSNNND